MAVPAALMLMTSGISRSAAMMTSVSSQSLRLRGCNLHPAMALITNARLLILLEAGKLILALSWRGALIVYFIFFLFLFLLILFFLILLFLSLQYPDVLDADSLLLGISDWEVIFCFRHLIPCTGSRTNLLRTRYQGRVIQNLTDAVCLFWGESHAVTDAVVHQIV